MRRIILALSIVLFGAIAVGAQSKKVTAAADAWPPFIDPDSPGQGLSLEIARAAFATQGYVLEMEFVPWARAEAAARDGQIDILPDIWMTEERKREFVFSDPYAANEVKFILKKGSGFEYKGMDSLTGKLVGVVRGYGYNDAFKKASNFKKEEAPDVLTNIKKLVAGRLDLTLEDQIVVSAFVKKSDPRLLEQIEFTKDSLSSNNLYIASGTKNPRARELIEAFNKGLAIIKANGKYAEIMKGYGLK
jgi:polar amino acid transport system substrate-binding protein